MELLLGLVLVTVLTLFTMDNAQGAPGSSPGVAPIPPRQLYAQFLIKIGKPGCKPKRIRSIKSFAKCMDGQEALVDYGCRYYNLLNPYCFCCGQICSYVEQGDICTRFCLKGSKATEGQEPIIDLPFDWGDDPVCTPELVEDSTTESNKSEDLQIQPEVDDVVDLRNDDMEIIPTPTAIKPDCVGNNCPTKPPTASNIPSTIKPAVEIPTICGGTASEPQYIPHPTDCQKYYQCAEGDPPVEITCEENLKFSALTNTCDHADHLECHQLY